MQPYEFKPDSATLTQQHNGQWIAGFEAAIFEHQVLSEISNSINAQNVRVIEFDVLGEEDNPVSYHEGSSAPYTRGMETQVELVLIRDGKKKGNISTSY